MASLRHGSRFSLNLQRAARWLSDSASNFGESRLITLLRQRFPQASAVEVQDISGGCGSMYEVWVEAPDFKGLSRVKQHKLITETLKAEIKDMHGLRISTSVSTET
ncbi:bolA-like protein 3 [Procambarus clarkii]|uniref:bolA-like protein 3 n=1 Tax=Procambarus clarkii TaxID=6728 RepID=UPI003742B3E4